MRQTLCIIMFFALAASTLSVLPPLLIGIDRCITDLDVGEDFESKLLSDPETTLSNPETRCYATCLLIKNNYLKSDGTLNVALMMDLSQNYFSDREGLLEVVEACAKEAGADICERAYKVFRCIITKDQTVR